MEARRTSMTGDKTVHDFNKDRRQLMVLGGYVVISKPNSRRLLNFFYLGGVLAVYLFLTSMAIITIFFSNIPKVFGKVMAIQALQTLCLLLVGLALPASKLTTATSLDYTVQLIKLGVYSYPGEVFDPEHDLIKSRRVKQIRFLMGWVTKLTLSCAFSNTFFIPLLQTMSSTEAESPLDPYLPLPIYMPVDTTTYLGFGFAFFTNAVFFFFLYATIACLIETYLSCSLQLIAQLEILNHSILNIEKRAFLRLVKINYLNANDTFSEDLYYNFQYQKSLYLCLRENILHHQAIFRLKEAMAQFIADINSICILSFSIVLAASVILIMENPTMNVALISTLTSDIYCYYEMCKVGQVITDKSFEVAESLYSTHWNKCQKKFTVLLKIMLIRAQKPIVMRATGFNASASLETYSEMMTLGYKIMSVFR